MTLFLACVHSVRNIHTPCSYYVGCIDTLKCFCACQIVCCDLGDGVGHTFSILFDGTCHCTGCDRVLCSVSSIYAEYRDHSSAFFVVAGVLESGNGSDRHLVVVGDNQLNHVARVHVVLGQDGGHVVLRNLTAPGAGLVHEVLLGIALIVELEGGLAGGNQLGIGVLLGIVLIARLISFLFERYGVQTYGAILGLVLASPFAIFYNTGLFGELSSLSIWAVLLGIMLMIGGAVVTNFVGEK